MQRGVALLLRQHCFPRRTQWDADCRQFSTLSFHAELRCPGADGSPWRKVVLGDAKQLSGTPRACHRPGGRQQRWIWAPSWSRHFFLGLLLVWGWNSTMGNFLLCVYVRKETRRVFRLHLLRQKCKVQGYFLSMFFFTEEGVVTAFWIRVKCPTKFFHDKYRNLVVF